MGRCRIPWASVLVRVNDLRFVDTPSLVKSSEKRILTIVQTPVSRHSGLCRFPFSLPLSSFSLLVPASLAFSDEASPC